MESKYISNKYGRSTEKYRTMWWQMQANDLPAGVIAELSYLSTQCQGLYYDMVVNSLVYGADFGTDASGGGPLWAGSRRLDNNVARSECDTLVAKICKNTPTVQYLTDDGDFDLQQMAMNLQRFMQGHFNHEKVSLLTPRCLLDSLIHGNGFIHSKIKNGKVKYELVRPIELKGLFVGSASQEPESIHICKIVDKFELASEFPDKIQEIFSSTSTCPYLVLDLPITVDDRYTLKIESYSKYAKRHTICVNNATLLDEDWDVKNEFGEVLFPIAVCRYKPSSRLYFCQGAIGEVRSLQGALDDIFYRLFVATQTVVVNKVLVPNGSNVQLVPLDNSIDMIVFDGPEAPKGMQLGSVPRDFYEQIEMYTDIIKQRIGTNKLDLPDQLPRLESATAVEATYFVGSDRFQMTVQAYEDLYIQLSDITYQLMKHKGDSNTTVLYSGKGYKTYIQWSDVNLDRDQFYMKVFTTADLPMTPGGKLDYVTVLEDRGYADRGAALELLDFPDTERWTREATADCDFVSQQISDMASGKQVFPNPYQDLDYALDKVRRNYLVYLKNGIATERLNNFSIYLNMIQNMKIQQNASQQLIMQAAAAQQMQQQASGNAGNPSYGSPTASGFSPQPSAVATMASSGNFTTTDRGF